VNKADVKTLVFCTGKFYYELTAEREKNERRDVACKDRAVVPVTSTVKRNQHPNADDYVQAQEEPNIKYSFMLMNFNLVKWRLASLKAYSASASGSSTRAKRRMADAIRMVLIKIYLIIEAIFN
jgi:2-oxoglutarate dehydrogenase E1 component